MAITKEAAYAGYRADAGQATLDMAGLLSAAYELGDMINFSADAADYVYWKGEMKRNEAVQALVKRFAKAKEKFEECQRFGRFHPDYHAAKEEAEAVQRELDEQESVRGFKAAEQSLDGLLFEVSTLIARAVSDEIKVPSNDPMPSSGCGCCPVCRTCRRPGSNSCGNTMRRPGVK
ncbi:regulator [Paenibacillus darwinianus]|uniref:YlbF family regulator n=1 Tax=Paenibacillus darwinianus TaxID=1380763 RepID=UPI00044707C4|nr:YlbF family regulator [Paenibacillus darwinianus]EXX85380.1 regulator [Paenibacillus darwinianus]